ncbi:hypothetical protein J437_LFUL006936 [Ladona fulva]|uniref:non-specific serine/threonine protein kinase n=1 Tax=Ladona fulva TaxID=123851 RepID=A0A8K0KAQ3_LADFU|nr:hypothetical protein J437_LFUL006936 [Ladona fulva]
MLHYHINADTPGVSEILQVLRESFAGIGDTDALYGCGIGHLFEPEGRIQHFKHLDKWEQVMRSYELEVAYCGQPEKLDGLLKSLQMLGMDELLMRFIDSKEMDQYDGLRYECAWRLGAWDQIPTLRNEKLPMLTELMEDFSRKGITAKSNEKEIDKLFHQHLFLAVSHIKSGKYKESLDLLDVARSLVINSLALSSLEACQNLYRPIARLQAIKSTEVFANAFLSKKKRILPFIIEEWERDDDVSQQSFNLAEPVKAVRLTLLEHCCQNTETSSNNASDLNYSNFKALVDIRLHQSIIAREANMFWVSEKYLRAVRQIPNVLSNVNFRLRLGLEEAKLFWSKGDKDVGKIILERLIAGENAEAHYLDYARALVTYGSWVMDTHSERGKAPLQKYFGRTIELMNENNHDKHSEDFLHAAKAFALFADENFIETKHRIQSSSFQQQKETALVSKNIATTYNKIHTATDEKRAASILLKLADIDQKEIANIENEKASFHCLALFNYIDVLRYSSDKDIDIIYRVVSLMLEPIRDRERIEAKIWCIPTFKFIPVIRQLIPRVIAEDENAKFFKKLIEKCALDHPHHILPALFAVAYSTRGIENIEGSYAFVTEGQKENTTAAQNILGDLIKKEILKDNILQLQKLWESLIDLAYINTSKKSCHDIPRGHSILKLRDLNSVQIPTIALKGSPVAKYKNIVTLHKYEPEFQLVGGINMPKKISCIGSDGVKYFQLLKGKDDPRQDAVMVQVVELINELMVKDKRAQKRNLIMRTYKVSRIAFEQGRLLKFPETVPFRLTRNIVDGMGVSGVQGVFKNEEVMRVIREHYRSVLTVLEVLIYDPLYAWTLKPFEQALKERREVSYSDDSYETEDGEKAGFFSSFGKPLKKFPEWRLNQNERNPYAVRALERIERKILGVEDGFPPSSIEAQVDKLIKIAQDPENLCALYSGWQPYL